MKYNRRATLRFAFKQSLPVLFGYLFLGAAFGIMLFKAGYNWVWAALISLLVYAGSGQFLLVSLISSGAGLATTALMTLFINTRHMFYGLSYIEKFKAGGWRYPFMIFTLTDETYSVNASILSVPDGVDEPRARFLIGELDHVYWIIGSVLGSLLSAALPMDFTGIDFSMTALFVVIFIDLIRNQKGRAGLIGALGLSTIYYIMTGLPGFLGLLAADKIKKWCHGYVNALIVMQACNILARIAAYFIGFEGKNLWFAMAVIGLGGIPLGAAAIAQTAIFCDSIDYMEWKTGKRTEGITFSMQTSFTKISSGITAGLATLALHLLHYKPIEGASTYLGTQSAAFDRWIWPLVILTPAIASLLYIVPLLFIRYTPAQRAQVEQELKARRAATDSQNT